MKNTATNRQAGNAFEVELCNILSEHGFWCHRLTQNASGQPADVIAARDGYTYLIDCKVCENNKFSLSRIEPNQESAMRLWKWCGNGPGWFAIKCDMGIFMVSETSLSELREKMSVLTDTQLELSAYKLNDWMLFYG